MPFNRGLLLASVVLGALSAQQTPKRELTARQLFYGAGPAPSPKPLASAKAPAKTPPRSTATPARPVEIATADPRPVPHQPSPAAAAAPAQTAPMPANGEPPLGIRYTVLKLGPGDVPAEVSPDTEFHSGDHIRFSVEGNAPGYLYIINQNANGTWVPMFPSADIDSGSNHIQGWRPYTMPPQQKLTFDSDAGTENLFIVFSRQPEPDLEKLIYSLKAGKAPAKTAETPVESDRSLIVAANIGNPLVERMRNSLGSRGLIVEKVDVNTPGDRKETAVYVVNPTGSADARVVADLHLVHK